MRQKMPDRRSSTTTRVLYPMPNGKEVHLLVTIGYDPETKKIGEVFCADFKVGTALHGIVTDCCIILSRCLQHGDTIQELYEGTTPESLVRILCEAIIKEMEALAVEPAVRIEK